MIIGSAHPSDANGLLKAVQHDLYWRNVSALFVAAARQWREGRVVERFGHRVLQAHKPDRRHLTLAARIGHRQPIAHAFHRTPARVGG